MSGKNTRNTRHSVLTRLPQIAVILPAAVKIARDMRRGLLNYARAHGPWGLHFVEGRPGEQKLREGSKWGCSGVIGILSTRGQKDLVVSLGVPAVVQVPLPRGGDASGAPPPSSNWVSVTCDTASIGRTGAAYFLGRQYRHFAYVGDTLDAAWSILRGEAYRKAVDAKGFECQVYPRLDKGVRLDAGRERAALCKWLRALPKPVALLAAWDGRARQVLDACMQCGIAVPDAVAILGVDDDAELCISSTPSLSSIALNAENVAYAGAEMLDAMMRGIASERHALPYEPTHVVERDSTRDIPVDDALVREALDFIALNAGEPIGVDEIARNVDVARRALERRFRAVLGQSVLDVLAEARLSRAARLLTETDDAVTQVVRKCGHRSPGYFCTLFRRRFGCTMKQYRDATHVRT